MKKIALINHGCAKNLVDSELMLGMLAGSNYQITLNEAEADIVIVNTCSFIHDAEQESVQSILKMVYEGKKVIVTGCLPQKYKDELKQAIPEVVAMLGTEDYKKIVEVIKKIETDNPDYLEEISEKPTYIYNEMVERQQITMGASSYIKIADGCNFKCGYCIIPQLRGEYHSRKMEDIVKEAKNMADKGVNEIVLIAQDTTSYGTDIYGKPQLAKLLEELNKIKNLSWIRVMYTYPSLFDDELIEAFAKLDKVVKYIDMPLQHSDLDMLKIMKRPVLDYKALINKLRSKIKDVVIRTTFIVGYPTETEEQFQNLYNFVKEMRFDKLGVFEFSREKNTFAYDLPEQISASCKKARKNKIMELQKNISKEINQSLIGKTIPCIIETINQDDNIIARTYRDAPEIDGLVYITNKTKVVPGDIENVKITAADEYDLWGTIEETD